MEHDWKIGDKEISANRYIDRPHWIGKNMKIFVFHKRVTSAEEDLIIKSLPIQHFLSSALLSLSNGLMNILAMVSGMEVRHGLRNIEFHSLMLIWLWPCMKAQPASSRDQHWALDMVPCPSDPGTEPGASALQTDSLPSELPGKPILQCQIFLHIKPRIDTLFLWVKLLLHLNFDDSGFHHIRQDHSPLEYFGSPRASSLIHKQAQPSGAACFHRLLLGSTISAGALPVGECCLLKCS